MQNLFVIITLISAVTFLANATYMTELSSSSRPTSTVKPMRAAYQPSIGCILCICQAASNCNPGNDEGPFKITKPYWIDAGMLQVDQQNTNNEEETWKACVNNQNCAEKTVIAYTRRFAQDCNGDGRIDCWDFAMIHLFGGYGCVSTKGLTGKFGKNFKECFQSKCVL